MRTHKSAVLDVVLPLFCFAIFLKNLAPTLFPGDPPELIVAGLTLSVTHGLGFPFYVLTARLFKHLPLGSLAWRINLLSCYSGILFVFLLYKVVNRFLLGTLNNRENGLRDQLSGLGSVLLLMGVSAFYYQVIRAEVYALYACFFCLLLWLKSLVETTADNARWWLLFALGAGLSLAGHFYMGVPVLVVLGTGALLSRRDLSLKTFLTAFMVLLLALTIFIYLPLRAVKAPVINYGGMEKLSAVTGNIVYLARLLSKPVKVGQRSLSFIYLFGEQISWPLMLIVVLGFFISLKRDWRSGLTLAFVVLTNIFVYFQDVDFSFTHLDTFGFELVTIIVFVFFAAVALHFIWEMLNSKKPLLKTVIVGGITLALLFRAIPLWSGLGEKNNFLAYNYALDTINSIGEGHLVLQSNNLIFPLSYLVQVEGRGGGIEFYNPFGGGVFVLVKHPSHYPRRELTRLRRALFRKIIRRNRPLFSEKQFNYLGKALQWRPWGLVYRLGDDGALPLNHQYLRMKGHNEFPFDDDSRGIVALYLIKMGAQAFAKGRVEEGNAMLSEAAAYAYDNPGILVELGAFYLEHKLTELAIAHLEKALKLKPWLAPAHTNLALALYYGRGDVLRAREHAVTALKIEPNDPDARNLLTKLKADR